MIRPMALAALTIALMACSGSQVREEVHQSVPAGAAPVVRIDNAVGEVRVTGWGNHSVDVDAVKTAMSVEEVRNISVDVKSQGNTIAIVTKYHAFARGGVRYTISVPAGASLDVTNGTGELDIDGVNGDVTAVTHTGELSANLGRVTGRRSVDLTATTGSLRLEIDPNSDARVDVHTSVGDASSDFSVIEPVRRNLIGAAASGTIGTGTATIRLSTTTGSISLRKSQ